MDGFYFNLAIEKGHSEIIKYLIEKGADVEKANNLYYAPLHTAAKGGFMDIVKILVEKGVFIDKHVEFRNQSTITEAAKNGHLEVVKYLIEKGAKVNRDGMIRESPLYAASENGRYQNKGKKCWKRGI